MTLPPFDTLSPRVRKAGNRLERISGLSRIALRWLPDEQHALRPDHFSRHIAQVVGCYWLLWRRDCRLTEIGKWFDMPTNQVRERIQHYLAYTHWRPGEDPDRIRLTVEATELFRRLEHEAIPVIPRPFTPTPAPPALHTGPPPPKRRFCQTCTQILPLDASKGDRT